VAGQAPVVVEITHAFHPRRGERLKAATRKKTWGEDRVMYYDTHGQLRSMLTSWTSLHELDSFMAASGGRSWFRVDDLLRLSALMAALQVSGDDKVGK
jgi:lipopolysaccharide biosynthesis protein